MHIEMEDVKVRVAGTEYTLRQLMQRVPQEYVDCFNGREFEDFHELSQQLMFANCAEEGRWYGRADVMRNNEVNLKYGRREVKNAE